MANFLIGTVLSLAVGGLSSALNNKSRYQVVEKGKQEEFQKPQSSYGDYIPQCWGRCRTSGILIWASYPPNEVVTTETTSEGGKGLGGAKSTTETQTYTYFGNFAVVIAQKYTNLEQIRFNNKLVWNAGEWDSVYSADGVILREYFGEGTQDVDPLLQSYITDIIPYRHRAYLVFENLNLTDFGNTYPQVSCVFRNVEQIFLSDVITEICLESEYLTVDDIDVSDLTSIEVTGFQITTEMSLAEKLQALQQAYFFDIVDGGGKLIFRQQYRSESLIIIPPQDCATSEEGQERPKQYTETRINLTDLPSQYEVRYFDYTRNLLQGTAYSSSFYNTKHTNIKTFNYPGCLTDSQAQTIANQLLWLDWERAYTQEVYLPLKYAYLEPNDVIELVIDGNIQQCQINSIEIGANNQLVVKLWKYRGQVYEFQSTASKYNSSNYTVTVGGSTDLGDVSLVSVKDTGGNTYTEGTDYTFVDGVFTPTNIPEGTQLILGTSTTNSENPITLPVPVMTDLRVLDIHQAIDSDPMGIYCFGYGGEGWKNAQVWVSRDNQLTWDMGGTLVTRSVFGTCDNTLGSGTYGVIDTVNSLQVTLTPYAELVTVSTEAIELGQNRALVGDEIIGFEVATLTGEDINGNRQYTLSNLHRGLRGTWDAIATHTAGENFYLLSGYKLVIKASIEDVGKTYYFKAITKGQTLDDVIDVPLLIEGNFLVRWIPEITAFSPTQGNEGDTVKLYGAGFNFATAVYFKEDILATFTIISDNEIHTTVPVGATGGKIRVEAIGGSGESPSEFIVGAIQWGDIGGTLSDQTDLQEALDAKLDDPFGTSLEYIRGDGFAFVFPAYPFGGLIEIPEDKIYTLFTAPQQYYIESLIVKCAGGSCTVSLQVNGIDVLGTTATVGVPQQSLLATGNNIIDTGNKVTLTVSGNASAADLEFTIALRVIYF